MEEREDEREREVVEDYMREHELEHHLNNAINRVVKDRPENPFLVLSDLLRNQSPSGQHGIRYIDAYEVLNSMGMPTVKVRLTTERGIFETALGGPSVKKSLDEDFIYDTGVPEDEQNEEKSFKTSVRYGGKGLETNALEIHNILQHKLENIDPTDQERIDEVLSQSVKQIGKQACLAISVSVCKAGARQIDLEVYQHIASLGDMPVENTCIPVPVVSLLNGGNIGSTKLYIQDIMIIPLNASSFEHAIRGVAELQIILKELMESRGIGYSNLGCFGGMSPLVQSAEEALEILTEASQKALEIIQPPLSFGIGLDVSASEFHIEDNSAHFYNIDKWIPASKGQKKSSDDLIDLYRRWSQNFKIMTFIDPFDKNDIKSFVSINTFENQDSQENSACIGGDKKCNVQVVGKELMDQGINNIIQENACNTVLIDPNQYCTVTEIIKNILEARHSGLIVIIGCSEGELKDEFVGDLAVGLGCGQVKFGGLRSAECVNRYNHLLELSRGPYAPIYTGDEFRR